MSAVLTPNVGSMRTGHVICSSSGGIHKMAYTDWGGVENPQVVLCVHGVTRNCRDFDALAQALASEYRVICPDIAGRGNSDWLANKDDYNYPQYVSDLTELIAQLVQPSVRFQSSNPPITPLSRPAQPEALYWVGTSMGGVLGMLLASAPNAPIAKLVLNDVGPLIPAAGIKRIANYVGTDPRFSTFDELEAYIREISASFGPLTNEQWRHLTLHSAIQHSDGRWGMRHDPGIAIPLHKAPPGDVDLWEYWDKIVCRTLVLRGAESDVLTKETVQQMQVRGPKAAAIEFPGIGHAPMLMAADQIAVVKDFLLEP